MTRAVLFDLDGTLIATKALYLESYRRAIGLVCGREFSDEEIIALKPRAELRFLPEQAGAAEAERCLDAFYRHYGELHGELFEGVYDGVPEMLEALRGAGHRLGIITGKSRRGWEITAARVELGPFDVRVFDDDVDEPKPHPGGILHALDALGVAPADACYVGDTIGDMRAAAAAGVTPVAALWSKKPSEREAFAARAEREGAVVLAEPGGVVEVVRTGR